MKEELFDVSCFEGCLVVSLAEVLDEFQGRKLQEIVEIHLQKTGKIVIDMSNVEYIDSQGLGALVGVHLFVKQIKGRMALSGLKGGALHVLISSQLAKMFQMEHSLDIAVKSLNSD